MESRSLKKRVVVNTSGTRYEVVKRVCKKLLGWAVSDSEESEEWDLFWTDNPVQAEKLSRMRKYQKINHFPGMFYISRKNYLATNLSKLQRLFPTEYNFFPQTWLVPANYSDLRKYLQTNKRHFVIVKPEASCQGKGIYLTNRIEDIDQQERHVVQKYLTRPFLIDGLKFDLRLYVLVTGCAPLRVFLHELGLTRFATTPYAAPSMRNCSDMCQHLTNYAVNKNNPDFIYNEDADTDDIGHKRSLQSTFDYLHELGYDVELLQRRIDSLIAKTLCSIQPLLAHSYMSSQPNDLTNSMCFELLGFDVILDHQLRPWLLEVNSSPSFSVDSPLDKKVKEIVIKDTLQLLNVSPKQRAKVQKSQRELIHRRAMTGKIERVSKEAKQEQASAEALRRDRWENNHHGGFRKIFPVADEPVYEQFIAAAYKLWQDWTGASVVRQKKEDLPPKEPPANRRVLKKEVRSERHLTKTSTEVFKRLTMPSTRRFKGHALPPIVYNKEGPHPLVEVAHKTLTPSQIPIMNSRLHSPGSALRGRWLGTMTQDLTLKP